MLGTMAGGENPGPGWQEGHRPDAWQTTSRCLKPKGDRRKSPLVVRSSVSDMAHGG